MSQKIIFKQRFWKKQLFYIKFILEHINLFHKHTQNLKILLIKIIIFKNLKENIFYIKINLKD